MTEPSNWDLDLAGFTRPTDGAAGPPIAVLSRWRAQRIWAEDGNLLWEGLAPEKLAVPEGVLGEFMRLSEGPESRILEFAGRWGQLGLCQEHFRPANHSLTRAMPFRVHGVRVCPLALEPRGTPEGSGGTLKVHGKEPLEAWRAYAQQVRLLARTSAQLAKNGSVDREDFEGLVSAFLDYWDGRVPHNLLEADDPSDKADQLVRHITGHWMRAGGAHLTCYPAGPIGDHLALEADSLLGLVGIELYLAVNGIDRFAICGGCARPFVPKRKPAEGRRTYCAECKDRKVPDKEAQRDRRKRLQGA